jgi:NADH dehydrogenase [ubiquinone] 1 alpha subcomplex assembly factor 7
VSLLAHLCQRIGDQGPLSVADYMATTLTHPEHGYYVTRDPLGAAGDFTTAPEISQMFGELLGLWAAQTWLDLGQPARIYLAELGPGRGTLMADALRAMRSVPGLLAATQVHLVEISPTLRRCQAQALSDSPCPPHWHESLAHIPNDAPLILLANEFFDALPIHQFVRTADGWRERGVGCDGQRLVWCERAASSLHPSQLPDGTAIALGKILEFCPSASACVADIAARLVQQGGAALIIDYGHNVADAVGDTFQALRAHRFVDPLSTPGQADLTAHVNFHTLARDAKASGARVFGPTAQGALLQALGIEQRAASLRRKATPAQSEQIDSALRRLTHADQMGRLFLAMALAGRQPAAIAGMPPPSE